MASGISFPHLFTVFTPTYNRAHTLHRVYESLVQQSLQDFEWLIVDDGSTDETKDLVAGWSEESAFSIRYVFQENQGKHVAINQGVERARGQFFVILDSDDRCVAHALERFYHHWSRIPESRKDEFAGVKGLCENENGEVIGDRLPEDVLDSTPQEVRYRYHLRGEKWACRRTAVMREFRFPEVEAAHVPENTVWFGIGRNYKIRFVNEVLRTYYVEDEAKTLTEKFSGSGTAHALHHRLLLNEELHWFPYAPLQFLRAAAHLVRFSLHAGESLGQQYKQLNSAPARVLWLCGLPLGYAVYASDRLM